MNSIKYLIVISTILVYSCHKKNNSVSDYGVPQSTISFNFKNDQTKYDALFNLIDSIEVVKLETNNESLIGSISKVLFDENYIYILDEYQSNSIFKFTKTGYFVLKISNTGKGPGEYLSLSDFILQSNKLVLLDDASPKIMYYSKNGDFISELSTKTVASNFEEIDTNYFCMFNGNITTPFSNRNISIIDSEGNILRNMMKIQPFSKDKHFSLYKPTDYFGEELLYTNIFSSNIFSIAKDTFLIKYHLDFGKNSLDEGFLLANEVLNAGELLLAINTNDIVNSIDYFNEIQNYFYFQCLKKGEIFHCYYNKDKNKPYIFNYQSFPDWLKSVYRPFIYSNENMFISVLEPDYIEIIKNEYLKDISENNIFSKLKPAIIQTDISDNPLIITYHFK